MQPQKSSLRIIQLTPPGRGAIATLRLEGVGAMAALTANFRIRKAADAGQSRVFLPNRLVVGRLGDAPGEEVVVRAHSAEVVELHCHGGRAAAAMIEGVLTAAGGHVIEWRDWVAAQEADPVAAAARVALGEARTERTAAILLDQYHGALRRALEEINAARRAGDLGAARRLAETLLARAALGRRLTQSWKVVVAGAPNVGKSSLINALVGYQRAIVHPTPGTTRDLVTVETAVEGWPIELCDTAGLRERGDVEGGDPKGGDAVEQIGIDLARQRLAAADLIVLVFETGASWTATDQALWDSYPGALTIYNKCDLPSAAGTRPPGPRVSALSGQGIDELAAEIAKNLVPEPPPPGAAVPFREEQVRWLAELNRGE